MSDETDKANDPLAKYANYRQEMQDAVDNGKGLGLFGPIFVALYDTLKVERATIATQAARIVELENNLRMADALYCGAVDTIAKLEGDLELAEGMLEQTGKESNMIFDRGAYRLARIKELEADNERLRAELAEAKGEMTPGQYLHALRVNGGFDLREVALAVDVDPGILRDVERDGGVPMEFLVERLAHHYGVPVDNLKRKIMGNL